MENAGCEVGNGDIITIWDKPWLSCEAQERPMGPAPMEFEHLTVADLMLPNYEWCKKLKNRVKNKRERKSKEGFLISLDLKNVITMGYQET